MSKREVNVTSMHKLGLLYVVGLVVITTATQVVAGQWAVTVGVAVLGVLLASVALGFRRHRAVLAALDAQKAKLSSTGRRMRRLESAQSGAAKAKKLEAFARTSFDQQRRLREDIATFKGDVDNKVTRLAEQLQRERVEKAQAHSQLVSSLADIKKQIAVVEAATRPPAKPPAGQRPFLAGEEMFQDLVLDGRSPSVVLVLDSFTPSQLFAGVRTALLAAVEIAMQTNRPLRLVAMRQPETTHDEAVAKLVDWIVYEADAPELAGELRVSFPEAPDRRGHHADDIWIATYWSTAFCLGRLADEGVVQRGRVVYLVQDWEPGFFPWGTEHALARATYSYGFRLIVNSTPLAEFIRDSTGTEVGPDHVFAPQVDQTRLAEAARLWKPSVDQPRLLLYARPSKPRNLYTLAVESVRRWVQDLPDSTRPLITLAGEDCGEVSFGPKADVVVEGKTDLDGYYELLTRTDLALALMHSPHPSHLPLELPMAGIPTVTNSMGHYRRPWFPNVYVCDPDPEAVARGLDKALAESADAVVHTPQELPDALGLPQSQVVSTVVRELEAQTDLDRDRR